MYGVVLDDQDTYSSLAGCTIVEFGPNEDHPLEDAVVQGVLYEDDLYRDTDENLFFLSACSPEPAYNRYWPRAGYEHGFCGCGAPYDEDGTCLSDIIGSHSQEAIDHGAILPGDSRTPKMGRGWYLKKGPPE